MYNVENINISNRIIIIIIIKYTNGLVILI
jgi:hypothetical protein